MISIDGYCEFTLWNEKGDRFDCQTSADLIKLLWAVPGDRRYEVMPHSQDTYKKDLEFVEKLNHQGEHKK